MKIRDGFVTNSSSTNFLILSKNELTKEYLFEKLGFKEGSSIEHLGWQLCDEILYGIEKGLRWHDFNEMNYENIKKAFGKRAADIFEEFSKANVYVYAGCTSSDSDWITTFFTLDSFELDSSDFYINGRSCLW